MACICYPQLSDTAAQSSFLPAAVVYQRLLEKVGSLRCGNAREPP